MSRNGKQLLASCVSLAIATWAGNATAAGFALIEQSVSNMGTAYAGGAAYANDTSTLFFNPAGMTRLEGTSASAGVQIIVPSSKFKDDGSSQFATALGGAPLGGGNGGDGGVAGAVPHVYFSQQLNEKMWLGFAINSPFGLSTEYDSNWVGRYHAIHSEIQTVNLNPSFAFKANDQFSFAVGISAQYIDAELTNAVDTATINRVRLSSAMDFNGNGISGTTGGIPNDPDDVNPGNWDGGVKHKGDSWAFGLNLGALFEVNEDTRIGAHFRSEVEHNVKGDVYYSGNASFIPTQGAKADITLPASASISVFHQATPELALMADYTWTGWSSIPKLLFTYDDGTQNYTTFNWRDTYRVSVGGEYQPGGSNWTYRLGAAYDQSPIDKDKFRTPRLPDADRIWLAVGAGVKLTDSTTLDIGYAHLFVDNPVLDKNADTTTNPAEVAAGTLSGSYDSSVDILSAQLEVRFD